MAAIKLEDQEPSGAQLTEISNIFALFGDLAALGRTINILRSWRGFCSTTFLLGNEEKKATNSQMKQFRLCVV